MSNKNEVCNRNSDLTRFIEVEETDFVKEQEKALRAFQQNPREVDFTKMTFSVTQLQMYESCPRKYEFCYVYKIPTPSRHYFDFGSSVHKVLEILVDDFNNKEISRAELFSKGIALLRKHWISKGYQDQEQEKEYFEKGVYSIDYFIDKELGLRREQEREILEKENRFLLDFEGRKIQGYIDRLDKTENGFEIIDYKTSNSMEPIDKLKNNMQLYVYSMAIKNRFNEFPSSVGLWYVVHDEIRAVNYDDLNSEQLRDRILKIIKKIESKDFKPTPTDFGCRFCDFNQICSHAKK